jgi:hypothetical protein
MFYTNVYACMFIFVALWCHAICACQLFFTCMCLLCNSRFKSTTWLELKDMAQDPLVRREPVSASCNRRPDEGLETQKYSLYHKEHPANCPLRWRLSNGFGCISHDCKLNLVTIQGNLTGDHYIRDVLQPVVAPHFDNHPLATRPVYMDDNARPHRSRAVTAYLQSEAVTSVPWPAMSPDLNPI